MKKKSAFLLCFIFLFSSHLVFAQNENKVNITEKSDYRIYENGKYIGLSSRESKSYIIQKNISKNKLSYFGEAFILQETKHNMRRVAKTVDDILNIQYSINLEEEAENPFQPQIFTEDSGYPILRNFPILPNRKFSPKDIGKTWTGKSTVVVKPIAENPATRIPVLVEFQYMGMSEYQNEKVHYVKALFGLRYKGTDEDGDFELIRSQGGRKVDIYLDLENRPLFIRENINEDFIYENGKNITHKGFILHFYSYSGFYYDSAHYQAKKLDQKLSQNQGKKLSKKSGLSTKKKTKQANIKTKQPNIKATKNFTVKQSERGTVLNLKNLNFVADRAILLKGEEKKLDEISAVLKKVDSDFFMIEGHTADIGNYEGQKNLSLDRAKTIAQELIKRGIPASKLIIRGAGGTKPIADNSSEDGRAKNRRVEITIF